MEESEKIIFTNRKEEYIIMKKFKKIALILACALLALSFAGCDSAEKKANNDLNVTADGLTEITLVLDWTPNTNHTGFYVADALGYYEEAGIKINIVQPPEDGATAMVAMGSAQFGIDFQDSLAPAFTADAAMPVTAVAAVLQHNTSGIISLKEDGISSPKGLEGKNYATWDLPVEQAMMQYVVEKDGGDFSKVNLIPEYVTDEAAALQQDIDAIWVYYGWAGIACNLAGLDTDYWNFTDIDKVFDYYSPVIVANNDFLEAHGNIAKDFLDATKKGYEYAVENPEDAAKILCNAVPELDANLVMESQKWISGQYKAEVTQWGYIDQNRWDAFYSWLYENNLCDKIEAGFGFTNEYLSK